MTLHELNIYTYEKDLENASCNISLAWKIANFVGLLLSGKLKDVKDYLPKPNKNIKNNNSQRENLILNAKKIAEQLGHKF